MSTSSEAKTHPRLDSSNSHSLLPSLRRKSKVIGAEGFGFFLRSAQVSREDSFFLQKSGANCKYMDLLRNLIMERYNPDITALKLDNSDFSVLFNPRTVSSDETLVEFYITRFQEFDSACSSRIIQRLSEHQDGTDRLGIDAAGNKLNQTSINASILKAQNIMLSSEDDQAREAFSVLLDELLMLSESSYGFLGEIISHNGTPALQMKALSNISWDQASEALYHSTASTGMLFPNLDNLLGRSALTGHITLANPSDFASHRSPLPPGHPRVDAFIGIPVYSGKRLIGVVGLANRHGGYSYDFAEHILPLTNTVGVLIERKNFYQERKSYQDNLIRAACIDPLTELPNRRRLDQLLNSAIGDAEEQSHAFSLCYLDLDNFKEINDSYGHHFGDALLVRVARRLTTCRENIDIAARIGGDEFVIILPGEQDESHYEAVVHHIQRPICIDGRCILPRISMGVARYPQDSTEQDLLMRYADQAMYQSKCIGKNRYTLFNLDEHSNDLERSGLIARIERGLQAGEFRLWYQAKVDLRSGGITGFEGLLRWKKDGKIVGPDAFIPATDNTSTGVALGQEVIRQSIIAIRQLNRQGLHYRVSINIAPSHMLNPCFIEQIDQIARSDNRDCLQLLCLEIVESGVLADFESANQVLQRCKSYGIAISLDDFGTGFSSLNYIRRLPVDEIKVDRTFVADMLTNSESAKIIESLILLADSFGKTLVAEGVETHHHVNALRTRGCQLGQGFYFHQPAPLAQVIADCIALKLQPVDA